MDRSYRYQYRHVFFVFFVDHGSYYSNSRRRYRRGLGKGVRNECRAWSMKVDVDEMLGLLSGCFSCVY